MNPLSAASSQFGNKVSTENEPVQLKEGHEYDGAFFYVLENLNANLAHKIKNLNDLSKDGVLTPTGEFASIHKELDQVFRDKNHSQKHFGETFQNKQVGRGNSINRGKEKEYTSSFISNDIKARNRFLGIDKGSSGPTSHPYDFSRRAKRNENALTSQSLQAELTSATPYDSNEHSKNFHVKGHKNLLDSIANYTLQQNNHASVGGMSKTSILDVSHIELLEPQNMIREIVQYMNVSRLAKAEKLNVIVHHHGLGRFDLHAVRGDDHRVNVTITTDSPQGRQFFVNHEEALSKALESVGAKLDGLNMRDGRASFSEESKLLEGHEGSGRRDDHYHENSDARRRRHLWEEYRRHYENA